MFQPHPDNRQNNLYCGRRILAAFTPCFFFKIALRIHCLGAACFESDFPRWNVDVTHSDAWSDKAAPEAKVTQLGHKTKQWWRGEYKKRINSHFLLVCFTMKGHLIALYETFWLFRLPEGGLNECIRIATHKQFLGCCVRLLLTDVKNGFMSNTVLMGVSVVVLERLENICFPHLWIPSWSQDWNQQMFGRSSSQGSLQT